MRHLKFSRLLLIFCFISFIMTYVGCDNSEASNYKTFALTKGIAHFSLEYRTYYKITYTGGSEDWVSGVELEGPIVNEAKNYTSIDVSVWVPGKYGVIDANTMLNSDMKIRATDPEYKLLDQSEIKINDVPAKQIVFSERDDRAQVLGIKEKYYDVYRRIYFDQNGLVWRITLRGDLSTVDADQVDFEHILQTFKFLH